MSNAPAAPTTVLDAPQGLEATQGPPALPDAPAVLVRPRRPHRRVRPLPPLTEEANDFASRHPDAARRSRAPVWLHRLPALCTDLAGKLGPPVKAPLPLSVACDLHGVSTDAVLAALAIGDLPSVRKARAQGVALCVQLAGTDPDNRNWPWLAERLRPKDLHLAREHKHQHQGSEDPSAPPITHAVSITLDVARSLARGAVLEAGPKRRLGGGDPPPTP